MSKVLKTILIILSGFTFCFSIRCSNLLLYRFKSVRLQLIATIRFNESVRSDLFILGSSSFSHCDGHRYFCHSFLSKESHQVQLKRRSWTIGFG